MIIRAERTPVKGIKRIGDCYFVGFLAVEPRLHAGECIFNIGGHVSHAGHLADAVFNHYHVGAHLGQSDTDGRLERLAEPCKVAGRRIISRHL